MKSGESADVICKITGADLTKFVKWKPGHGVALHKGDDMKLNVTTTYADGKF